VAADSRLFLRSHSSRASTLSEKGARVCELTKQKKFKIPTSVPKHVKKVKNKQQLSRRENTTDACMTLGKGES
jgi:hypothetical protein